MTFAEAAGCAILKLRAAGFSTNQAILGLHMVVEEIGQRIERDDELVADKRLSESNSKEQT